MPSHRKFWNHPLAPLRYAVVWALYAVLRVLVVLPLGMQLGICKAGGSVLYALAGSRRRVVATNLSLCFPELAPKARRALARRHFRELGASLAEMAMGWYGAPERIRQVITIDGLEHLEEALERGRGVILFSGHFTSFEIFFPVLSPLCPRLCGMYKLQRNPLMNAVMTRGRSRNFDHLFIKESVREMLRELKGNAVVWYASDQSYASKGCALIPFFGEPAMTNTAVSRIARISGASVLPYFPRRLPGDPAYRMTIGAPLADFPSGNEIEDTRRLIASMEEHIRACPEQYWWVHKRFKSRPAPYPDVYASASEPA